MELNINRTHGLFKPNMPINEKLVKDGYIYLFRGDNSGFENGFHSKFYKKNIMLSDIQNPVEEIAELHTLDCISPFISTTARPIVAAMYSKKRNIYLLRIPLKDIYVYSDSESFDLEQEYLVPDLISKDEIVKVFKHDEIKELYYYLVNEIGLNITPDDIGLFGIYNIEDFNVRDLYRLEDSFIGDENDTFMVFDPLDHSIDNFSKQLEKTYKIKK